MAYGRFFPYKARAMPPRCVKVSGTVFLSGTTPQPDAIVDMIDETDQTFVGRKIADASGLYSFDSGYPIMFGHTYHVTAKYDSGTQKYNSYSQPYVVPAENG